MWKGKKEKTLSANLAGPNLEWWELTHLPYYCWQRDLSEGVVLLRTLQRTLRVANTAAAAPRENVDCRMIDGSYLWLPNPHRFSTTSTHPCLRLLLLFSQVCGSEAVKGWLITCNAVCELLPVTFGEGVAQPLNPPMRKERDKRPGSEEMSAFTA